MIRFLVEALFAVVFAQAFVTYVRERDPIQRDVMAVFSAVAMLFVLDVARQLLGEPPAALRAVALILLFCQPYLTIRLVHRVRPVPRWLHLAALGGAVVSVLPVVTAPKLSHSALAGVLAVYVAGELVAAGLLAREARSRTGSPRVRLSIAAASTAAFGLAIVAASFGTVVASLRETGRTFGYACALASALGYVVAFRPSAWVRRLWSGTVSYRVSRQLLEAPATDTPNQTWSRYAQTVREVSGADAVFVVPAERSGVQQVATAGLWRREVIAGNGAVSRLLHLPVAAEVTARAAQIPDFALVFAGEVGARFLTATPLRSPLGGVGALVLLNRRRALFAEDDVRLLGELGAHAAIVAERGAVRDEQDRLAQELALSVQALSTASQAKSDFLASMSHELRTPLNAIIGFSELMRGEEAVSGARVVPTEWIDHIYSSGRHLLDLINDVLDLTKIEADRMELYPERVELPILVNDAVNTLRPLIERKQLHLRVAVPAGTVHGDRVRLRQVLDNLLSNAIKYTPEGGRLTVESTRSGGEVRIAMIDSGVGIDPADQERVFEKFQQVGDVALHQAGTGLGLALTRRLVESHGGRVEVESTPGVGSRFTVCLPDDEPVEGDPGPGTAGDSSAAAPVHPRQHPAGSVDLWEQLAGSTAAGPAAAQVTVIVEAGAAAAAAAAVGAVDSALTAAGLERAITATVPGVARPRFTGGILLVEDEASAARLVRTYLEGAGYVVRTATTGEDGLAAARADRPDAVVLDVLLPGISGWEVLRLLKQDPQLRDVPVFVVSVVDERDVGLSLGAVDFFVKPVNRQQLLDRVTELVRQSGTGVDRMQVLAVDDDPEALTVIAATLREQHVDVVTAGTGREAVRLARTQSFDLIISDLLMPDVDGISLMNALDHDPASGGLPVLVVTGAELADAEPGGPDAMAFGVLPRSDGVGTALRHWKARPPRITVPPPDGDAVDRPGSAGHTTTGPEATS